MFEVIEGVMTRAALTNLMFPHSYEGITLLRALHECRYLKNLYENKKDHIENLSKVVNKVSVE